MQQSIRQLVAIVSCTLSLCALAFLAPASPAWASPANADDVQEKFLSTLSPEERTWLQEHPDISMGVMNAWPPLNYVDAAGTPRGLGVKYIQALNLRISGVIHSVPGAFGDNLKAVEAKNLEALMDVSPKPEREEFLNFTRQYLNIPHAIIASSSGRRFHSEQDLRGYTLALEKGFYNVTYFRTKYPSITIREYPDTAQALDAVSRGDADAYVGNRAVGTTPLFKLASSIALYHHERWDGGGYPSGLKGEDIPEAARIAAIADVFDALTSQSPYKKPWPVDQALEHIANSNGHFEPRLAELFCSLKTELLQIMDDWAHKEI